MKAPLLLLTACVSLITACNSPERKQADKASKLTEIRKYIENIHRQIDAEKALNRPLEPLITDSGFQYEIMSRDSTGSYLSFNFYVDPRNYKTHEVVKMILSIRDVYCSQSRPCNLLNFWKDKTAYGLDQQYQDEKLIDRFGMELKAWERRTEWRKSKNWVFICENFIASYNGVTHELIYFPYFDYEYRRYGGQMQRPDSTQLVD